jgi:hypothetical protein
MHPGDSLLAYADLSLDEKGEGNGYSVDPRRQSQRDDATTASPVKIPKRSELMIRRLAAAAILLSVASVHAFASSNPEPYTNRDYKNHEWTSTVHTGHPEIIAGG